MRVELTTNQQSADSKAGSNSQQTNSTSSQQRFEGWEFWDERYTAPPAMLSKKSCGKMCSDYPDLYKLLPEEYPSNREVFGSNKSCAIISSSKVLDKYEYGAQIDAHDVILRFNLHPIRDARREGRRTTHMMVHCGFWNAAEPQYKKLYLIQNRTENIILFYARMHHEIKKGPLSKKYFTNYLFPKYTEFLKARSSRSNETFILNHDFIKKSRDAFEASSGAKLKFYPSSGFMGLFLMSRTCARITAFGFSDAELKTDYRFIGKTLTHDFQGEHKAMKRWVKYINPSVQFNILP